MLKIRLSYRIFPEQVVRCCPQSDKPGIAAKSGVMLLCHLKNSQRICRHPAGDIETRQVQSRAIALVTGRNKNTPQLGVFLILEFPIGPAAPVLKGAKSMASLL